MMILLIVTISTPSTTPSPTPQTNEQDNSMVSCQKGPTRHACAWQIGPFWQDTLVVTYIRLLLDNSEEIPIPRSTVYSAVARFTNMD